MILSAQSIRERNIISPFVERTVAESGLTFGCGPCSYDVRVEFDSEGTVPEIWLCPGEFVLASTIERFTMPRDVMAVAHDKSTWARRGLAVQNTLIDPCWCGYLTLELSNHTNRVLRIKRGDPIAQIVFHLLDEPTHIAYSGVYQDQPRGPMLPK